MKRKAILSRTVFLILFLFAIQFVMASDPPPPPPGHGETGNVPGGGAPLGSGLAILLAMGAAYGSMEVFNLAQKTKTNNHE